MAPRANCRIAANTFCAAAHGRTTRATCAARAATTTTRMCAILLTDSAWHDRKATEMSKMTRRAILAAAALAPAAALAQSTAPSDAYLYIIWPNDGQRIKGGFWCRFGLRNMGIARAGDKTENAGHHHLLIDVNDAL